MERLEHYFLTYKRGPDGEDWVSKDVAGAGASVLVAGSAVYLDPDGVAAALAKFRKAIA